MTEIDKVNADISHAVNKIIEGSPELRSLFATNDPKLTFPGDYRWHYFKLAVGKRYYMYAYSTTRNANHKFLSWVYKPYYKTVRDEKGKYHKAQAWNYTAVRETRRYKSAKDRAYKKYRSHMAKIANAAINRAQKQGGEATPTLPPAIPSV